MITVNGNELEWSEGMTVRDVLKAMNYNFTLIVLKVNGQLVKRENWGDFQVPDGAVVDAMHLISGG